MKEKDAKLNMLTKRLRKKQDEIEGLLTKHKGRLWLKSKSEFLTPTLTE